MAVKYSTGDIFAFQLPGDRYGFAKIVLDIETQCVKKKLIAPDSPLMTFSAALLVDVYSGESSDRNYVPGDCLVQGLFVAARDLKQSGWPLAGHEDVDPSKVEFPEGVMGFQGGARFRRGEFVHPLNLVRGDVQRIEAYPAVLAPISLVNAFLYHSGRQDQVTFEKKELGSLASRDLRYNRHRDEVYRLLKLDPDESYHSLSMRHGFDISRFYR